MALVKQAVLERRVCGIVPVVHIQSFWFEFFSLFRVHRRIGLFSAVFAGRRRVERGQPSEARMDPETPLLAGLRTTAVPLLTPIFCIANSNLISGLPSFTFIVSRRHSTILCDCNSGSRSALLAAAELPRCARPRENRPLGRIAGCRRKPNVHKSLQRIPSRVLTGPPNEGVGRISRPAGRAACHFLYVNISMQEIAHIVPVAQIRLETPVSPRCVDSVAGCSCSRKARAASRDRLLASPATGPPTPAARVPGA